MKSSFLIALVLIVATSALQAAPPPRPNILFFYVDDMGWGSIGPNGQAERKANNLPYVRTPSLDRLAAEGLNFTRGYGCHVCSPARSSLQTGFHQGHTFADRNDPNNARKAIRAEDVSIGDVLSNAGYTTGYWGKWGYGASKDQNNPVIQNVQTLPTSHGYQFVLAELHHVRAHTFFQPTLWSAPAAANSIGGLELISNSMSRYQNNAAYPKTPAIQDDAEYPTTAYCDDAYAFAALDFVRTQGQVYNKTGQPFHGLLAVQIPHAPFGEVATLPGWNDAYRDDPKFSSLSQQTQQWAAMVTRIDSHFGNILAALDDPNGDGDTSDSIARDTLVVFQSDNGGPGGRSNIELDANGGLRGTKGKIQEGGIRVPMVMRWPAKINSETKLRAGTNCDRVVDVTDLLPTFCELAGADIPPGIDGVSIAPTLTGRGHQRTRDFIIHEASNGQSIIHGKHKLVRSKKGPLKLYDLSKDREETKNIAAGHPKLVRKLKSLLLGERVDEPRGFANTYHHWTGETGASTSDSNNWSDYRYANAGITYAEDKGSPQMSWIAKIENQGKVSNNAQVNDNLEVLGLLIQGNSSGDAMQTVTLDPDVNLLGRNEIRLAGNSALTINGGTVSSLRWVDVHPDAKLGGYGAVSGTVYNNGTLETTSEKGSFSINGAYVQGNDAVLRFHVTKDHTNALVVNGEATLDGRLEIVFEGGLSDASSFNVVTANGINGKFANPSDLVVTPDGQRYSIEYAEKGVTVTRK